MSNEEISVNVYEAITSQIVASIENGVGEVQLPWHRKGFNIGRPSNVKTNNTYNGINILALWLSSHINGYEHGLWGTFKQWSEKGAKIKKGEKSTIIVFYKDFVKEGEGDEVTHYSVAKASRVFNIAQVEGFEIPNQEPQIDRIDPIEFAEQFVIATRAKISIGGTRAFYSPSSDSITMPDRHRFVGTDTSSPTEGFYSTLFHELTHWTGASHRLDREFGDRFGDNKYAMEELVAELGAAFLCSQLGISIQPREDHATYINNWLQVLKKDPKAIFTASSKASKASDYLMSFLEQSSLAEAA